MSQKDWMQTDRRYLGVIFDGKEIDDFDEEGNLLVGKQSGDYFSTPSGKDMEFQLPPRAGESYMQSSLFQQT